MSSKRKRSNPPVKPQLAAKTTTSSSLLPPVALGSHEGKTVNLQIIAGSYDKVLHGFIASIPITSLSTRSSVTPEPEQPTEPALQQDVNLTTTFSDSFLFTAHTAPLRCIALSPPSASTSKPGSSKRILATGAPDERINLYTLSSSISSIAPSSALSETKTKSTASNKHLGTLHEHTNTPSVLLFTPNRTKLITAGEDSQILIFRTRDWSLLSTLKAPKPKGSAKNAGIGLLGNGERPGGVNDLALHPSQKILFSVSKGERAMRMWNLMTGRKAGTLGFTKEVMGIELGNRIGGASGEAQKVRWSPDGEEFAVAFERGVIVFGMDSQPKLRILPSPISKVHQIHYVPLPGDDSYLLVISTEDGRMIFYSTRPQNQPDSAELPNSTNGKSKPSSKRAEDNEAPNQPLNINNPIVLGQVGGREMGMMGRVKDFVVLEADVPSERDESSQDKSKALFAVSAGSDGTIRIWNLHIEQLKNLLVGPNASLYPPNKKLKTTEAAEATTTRKISQVGSLMGIYETGRRITCLSGMVVGEGWDVEDEAEDSGEEDDDEDDSDGSEDE